MYRMSFFMKQTKTILFLLGLNTNPYSINVSIIKLQPTSFKICAAILVKSSTLAKKISQANKTASGPKLFQPLSKHFQGTFLQLLVWRIPGNESGRHGELPENHNFSKHCDRISVFVREPSHELQRSLRAIFSKISPSCANTLVLITVLINNQVC